jgi:hypothetical protein
MIVSSFQGEYNGRILKEARQRPQYFIESMERIVPQKNHDNDQESDNGNFTITNQLYPPCGIDAFNTLILQRT